jgi:hypothetical protein
MLADKKLSICFRSELLTDLTFEGNSEKLKELKLEHSKKAVSKKSPI